MKLSTKQLQQLTTIYVYGDGHAVLKFEKRDAQAGTVEWVEVVEQLVPRCQFKGRLIFSSFYEHCNFALARFVLNAERLEASESGSEATREKGYTVNHCAIRTKDGTISLTSIPSLISGCFTWQPEHVETYEQLADKCSWGSMTIAKRHPVQALTTA